MRLVSHRSSVVLSKYTVKGNAIHIPHLVARIAIYLQVDNYCFLYFWQCAIIRKLAAVQFNFLTCTKDYDCSSQFLNLLTRSIRLVRCPISSGKETSLLLLTMSTCSPGSKHRDSGNVANWFRLKNN